MKRFFVLMSGILFLSTINSIATPLEDFGVRVEMFHECIKDHDISTGPQRTKGKQPYCPISVYVNNIDKYIALVGIDNTLTISYVISNEQGADIISDSISNDSTTIDISNLTDGSYVIHVIINGISYVGTFHITSE